MTIPQIIAHELLGLRTVCLPFVGTLYAHRVPVHRAQGADKDGVRLLPPGIEISLDGTFSDDRSVIALLQVYFPELDPQAATLLYNQWVEEASGVEPDTLIVEGVCRISTLDYSLSIDPATTAMLHTGRTLSLSDFSLIAQVSAPRPIATPRRQIAMVRVWPAALVLVAATLYILYRFLG